MRRTILRDQILRNTAGPKRIEGVLARDMSGKRFGGKKIMRLPMVKTPIIVLIIMMQSLRPGEGEGEFIGRAVKNSAGKRRRLGSGINIKRISEEPIREKAGMPMEEAVFPQGWEKSFRGWT